MSSRACLFNSLCDDYTIRFLYLGENHEIFLPEADLVHPLLVNNFVYAGTEPLASGIFQTSHIQLRDSLGRHHSHWEVVTSDNTESYTHVPLYPHRLKILPQYGYSWRVSNSLYYVSIPPASLSTGRSRSLFIIRRSLVSPIFDTILEPLDPRRYDFFPYHYIGFSTHLCSMRAVITLSCFASLVVHS